MTVKHSCRKKPGKVNFIVCIFFVCLFLQLAEQKAYVSKFARTREQQLVPGLMLGAGCKAASRALFCPGEAGEEMRSPSEMCRLQQCCPAPSLQALLPVRLVHGKERGNSASEGGGEIVFIKKKKKKWEMRENNLLADI